MAVITYREALNQALAEEMERDPDVFLMGEEVGVYNGAYKVSKGLLDRFGAELFWADGPLPSDRCNACVGAAIGVEIMFGQAYDRILRRDKRRLPTETEPDDDR